MGTFDFSSIPSFVKDISTLKVFSPDPDYQNTPAIELKLDPGSSPLVIITGENASGKSFVRRAMCFAHQKTGVEFMHFSQQGRSTTGMARAFIYGSEDDESTGYISSHSVLKAISTSKSRTGKHSLFFDEPDIGLADNYSASLGKAIADYCLNPSPNLFGIFVVSHNKALVREFIQPKSTLNPHHLRVAGCPDLQTWLNQQIVYSNLEELHDRSLELWRRIQKLMNNK